MFVLSSNVAKWFMNGESCYCVNIVDFYVNIVDFYVGNCFIHPTVCHWVHMVVKSSLDKSRLLLDIVTFFSSFSLAKISMEYCWLSISSLAKKSCATGLCCVLLIWDSCCLNLPLIVCFVWLHIFCCSAYGSYSLCNFSIGNWNCL